jgi:peptidase M48-like protein
VDRTLRPLPYHRDVAAIFEAEQPEALAALIPSASGSTSQVHDALLRHAYRLDPAGHPQPHAAVARAAMALGVTVPVDLFAFEGARGNNAELVFVRERPVIALSGDTLNLLDPEELCAVAGHELAHYVLWTADGGRHLAASRLLDAAETDARTDAEYLETARRLRLATELFADRGALVSCGSLTTALRSLLKLATGLAQVDPDGYLRQAAEVDLSGPSAGSSHPETVLRAWALQKWGQYGDAAEPDIARALAGQLDLNALDILDQDRLRTVTQVLIGALLAYEDMRTEDVVDHAGQFGVQVGADAQLDLSVDELAPETRRYLAAVLLDFATVDVELGVDGLARVFRLARRAGLSAELDKLVATELALTDRERSKILARMDELARA